MVKQISVFLENKEGNLAEFSRLLSENDINLRALSMAEAGEFGIVRMIVDDVYKATTSLKEADYVASVKDVLAVEIPDEAGSLAKVLAVLGSESVNVEYMYAFTNHTPGKGTDSEQTYTSAKEGKQFRQPFPLRTHTVFDIVKRSA